MVHGTNPGMVQSALRTRNWIAAGIIGLMVLIAMIFVLPANVSADDSVNIGNHEYTTAADAKKGLEDSGVAEVTINGNTINIKMIQNVKGRISLKISGVHINFDANGKTLNGAGTEEPLCFNHVYKGDSTATISGNGTFLAGYNWGIFVGLHNTVTIESGTTVRGSVGGGGTIIEGSHTHDYTTSTESSKYLKTTATNCQEHNIYWYACSICGASAGDDATATNKYYTGTLVGAHQLSDWQHGTEGGGQYHYKKCTVAGCNHTEQATICSGGKATCQEAAKCTTCGAAYGTKADHNYVWVITDEMHWMQCQTEGCDSIAERGGHFDMDKDGKCDACTYEMKLTPDPVTPADPKNPDTVKTAEVSQQTTDKAPKTGDDSFAAPLLAVLFLSGSVGAVCIANRKRDNM